MILYRVLSLFTAALAVYANSKIQSEYFEEDLVIRPLKDGRLATLFSFTTTLENITPRNPESLDGDDDCMYSRR